ncbi:hypothetical protein CEXT_315201 [Caerostris extrusa]|uniref:Uncharacterized protein n=1 Tax=Caerostris extrusa TaxID=172846 RepID=A0AAV4MAN8_CAEEX|nr:hypothetical protein CEXT_315201 [Caerostris extrusa]
MPGSHTCMMNGQQMRQFMKSRNVVFQIGRHPGDKNTKNKKKGVGEGRNVSPDSSLISKLSVFIVCSFAVGDAFNAFCDLASFPALER